MTIASGKEEEVLLTAEEEAELDAACEEADRGELVSSDEVLREVRAITEEAIARCR